MEDMGEREEGEGMKKESERERRANEGLVREREIEMCNFNKYTKTEHSKSTVAQMNEQD